MSKCQLALLKNLADKQNQESYIFSDFKQLFVDRLSEHIPPTFSRQKSVPSGIPIVDTSLSKPVSTSSRASSVQEAPLSHGSIDSTILNNTNYLSIKKRCQNNELLLVDHKNLLYYIYSTRIRWITSYHKFTYINR